MQQTNCIALVYICALLMFINIPLLFTGKAVFEDLTQSLNLL